MLKVAGVVVAVLALAGLGASRLSSNGSESKLTRDPGAAPHGRAAIRADCKPPYAKSSPWNTPVGEDPLYARDTASLVSSLSGVLTSDPTQYTYPVYSASLPLVDVNIRGTYSDVRSNSAVLKRHYGGTVVRVGIPSHAQAAAGSDAQLIVLDPSRGDEWGFWQLARDASGHWTATNGYHYNTRWSGVPPRGFGSRGAGVPYLAGLVRPCEIEQGHIDHALAFAYDWPSPDHVYPATRSDGRGTRGVDLPEGSRLQLDPALTPDAIRAWGCQGSCYTIARALQKYGMYVIDNGGHEKVMLEDDTTAQWHGLVSANTTTPIPLAAFRVVRDKPPVVRALASGGRAGTTTRLRYTVYAGGGQTRETVTVKARGAVVATLSNRFHDAANGKRYAIAWDGRRSGGALNFCVVAHDPAGQRSAASCAALTLR